MPPIKLQNGPTSSSARALDDVDPTSLVMSVGDAIADAASERRGSLGEDSRQAARRAAVEIATAALLANCAETAAHSDDVDVISEGIARRLGLSGQRLDDVLVAARLHDIGKLGVPSRLLKKPASLSPMEWKLIHRHTIIGEQILLAVPELRSAARLVRHSHERWDGSGYPDKLAGEEIPLGSRIVFCADAFHAIRSHRPYRAGRSAAEALAEIQSCAGTQFDPAVVAALEELSVDMRANSNGTRPGTRRAGRLMALMLVVSVGACSSAFARSGLMGAPSKSSSPPEARSGPQAPGAAPSTGGIGNALRSTGASGQTPNTGLSVAIGAIGTAGFPSLLSPGLALGPPAPFSVLGALGAAGAGQSPTGSGPASADGPGVRDHGRGVGRGKGQGAVHRHGQQKKSTGAAASAAAHGKPHAHRGSAKKSSSGLSASAGGSNHKSSGNTLGHAKSGKAAGGASSSTPTKAPKPATAPKAPKSTAAPAQSSSAPQATGGDSQSGGGSAAGSPNAGSADRTAGGDGQA